MKRKLEIRTNDGYSYKFYSSLAEFFACWTGYTEADVALVIRHF